MRLIDADELAARFIPEQCYFTEAIKYKIKTAQTVDASPVNHGKWEYSENIYDESTWVCSACNEPWTLIDGTPQENGMKYCPECGAKMDLEGLDAAD